MSSRFAALAELVRAPAALTVPGDTLAGSAAAGRPLLGRRLALPAASVALYWAGMALNDFADRQLDASERPERPIPSGRVSPAEALGVAGGLTALGIALAGLGGGRDAVRVAVPLAGAVWAYDLVLKSTPAGPLAMAACRGLDVLLGAGATGVRHALPAAAVVAGHTLAVTALARGEVHGGAPTGGAAAAATTFAAALTTSWRACKYHQPLVSGPLSTTNSASLLSLVPPRRDVGVPRALRRDGGRPRLGGGAAPRWGRVLGVLAAAGYAASVGRAQLSAAREPSAQTIRRATVAGIHGMVPLQAALAASAGSRRGALAVLAALPAARLLARAVSPT